MDPYFNSRKNAAENLFQIAEGIKEKGNKSSETDKTLATLIYSFINEHQLERLKMDSKKAGPNYSQMDSESLTALANSYFQEISGLDEREKQAKSPLESDLREAAANNDKKETQRLIKQIKEERASLNTPNPDGNTALMLALQHIYPSSDSSAMMESDESMDFSCAYALIEAGAAINTRNHRGETPLMLAVSSGDMDLVKTLVEGGAELNFVNQEGHTALSLANLDPTISNYLKEKGAVISERFLDLP